MKILLVSDTHGNNESLDYLVKKYPNMDLYLHCGDSESDEFSIHPYRSVKGNCDYIGDFPMYLIIPTPYGNMMVHHKPLIDSNVLRDNNAKIFVYGHTHRREFTKENGIYLINPGAISFARDKYDYSYAILDISEKEVKVDFHTLDEKWAIYNICIKND